ncbi:ribonuclease H-like domain-containing protein [Tanacetum coccineum]
MSSSSTRRYYSRYQDEDIATKKHCNCRPPNPLKVKVAWTRINPGRRFKGCSIYMCDKKNKVLFTDTECLVLSPDFKLPDENQVLLRVPRQNNMYSFNLENIFPTGGLACLITNATVDESNKWHRRLGHVNFKNLNKLVKGNLVRGKGPNWLFDLDYLTDSMNYQPVTAENKANKTAGPKEANHSQGENTLYCHYGLLILQQSRAQKQRMEMKSLMGILVQRQLRSQKIRKIKPFWRSLKGLKYKKRRLMMQLKLLEMSLLNVLLQAGAARATSTNTVNTVSIPISTASPSRVFSAGGPDLPNNDQDDSQIPALEEIFDNPSDGIFTNASYDDEGAVADFNNLAIHCECLSFSHIKDTLIHPTTQILWRSICAVQTRSKVNKSSGAHAFVSYILKQRRNNHKDFQHCLFACFLSQIKPKMISQSLKDKSWVDRGRTGP